MSDPHILLSPPQYTLWRELAYSFGADPEISVRNPYEADNTYIIELIVENDNRAPAVAGILKETYNFGGIQVKVLVRDGAGNYVLPPDITQPEFLVRQMIETALFANPYFYQVIPAKKPEDPTQELIAVFYPEVIQFWNDDLSDPFGYAHFVAQNVFAEVIRADYDGGTHLRFTTVSGKTFL